MKPGWIDDRAREIDVDRYEAALARQLQLTKPAGSLGRLEDFATRLAGLQGVERPTLDRVGIVVFAADHGIAAEGVSLFPQSVTVEMIRNFASGGAAISAAARQLGASLEVVDVGSVSDPGSLNGVVSARIGSGTANFLQQPAMDEAQLTTAMGVGRDAVLRAIERKAQIFIGGEMGIANTTSATALACALLDADPDEIAGPGTGLDAAGVNHKVTVIRQALQRHRFAFVDPWQTLRCVGGYEIAALSGAYIACAQSGMPALIDGFITSAAALAALRLRPDIAPWLFYAHTSAEPGHARILRALDVEPILNLGMRLGEGSGAAVAVPVLRMACALHNEMATFAEAGVSESHG